MEDDRTIVVRTFFTEDDAENVRQQLQSNGINAYVSKPNIERANTPPVPRKGVRLVVLELNVDRVFEILEPLGVE